MTSQAPRWQLATLVVLGIVLVLVLRWQLAAPVPGGGTPAAPNTARSPAGATGTDEEAADVHLEALNAARQELQDPERNPFRFQPRVVPAPPRPEQAPTAFTPPVPTGPPPPPPIPLKFIGVLDAPPRVGRMAILSDGRGNVFYGKEGDIIEGRFRVLRIDTEFAELAYVDGRGRQSIRLSGQ